ncbi:MAG: serine/threonine protein kinase [Gammaproteobacteria bacterium]|nr:MAG: serine/threonine protein kinase [Gammaproteobacteria bacterium]
MTAQLPHPFDALTPDFLIDAVESQGLLCDGRLFPLNSYENRVYQIGIEDAEPIIAKFYRPQRWTDDQILEEHEYCLELAAHELPVVPPWQNETGDSLFKYGDFRYALFLRRGGHAPELGDLDSLFTIGRLLGRIHLVGASRPFIHRPTLNIESYGYRSVEIISEGFIPASLQASYQSLTADLLQVLQEKLAILKDIPLLRAHGDCHIGNILWRDDTPHFVDFDDARMAPAVQDLWMLLSGNRAEQTTQMSEVVDGYNEFYDFHPRELNLVEPLRALRILHYTAWIASRWDDPAFPRAFSWFNTERFWGEHILELREQYATLTEPPLELA